MKIEVARQIWEGKLKLEDIKSTAGERMQLLMGACLTDDGNIWCLKCNQPNEYCTCEFK